MRIKASSDLVSALRGSAFRRITCDGRTWHVREIMTQRALHGAGKRLLPGARALERVQTGRL